MKKSNATLKRENRAQKQTIKQLRAVVGRLQKSLDIQARKTARTKNALNEVLRRLNMADNAYAPTSKQLMRETRKEQAAEDKKHTGKRPGPKDGHPGTTDERPVTRQVRFRLPACRGCGGKWIRITEMSEGTVTEVEMVVHKKIRTTHLVGECMGCGHRVEGKFLSDDVEPVKTNAMSGGNAGGETIDVGNGLVQIKRTEDQIKRTEDKEATVGDVVECADTDGETLNVPRDD